MDGISMADVFIPDMKSYQEAKALGIEDNLILTTILYDSSWISLMNDICEKIEYFANADRCEMAFTRTLINNYKRAYSYINDSIKYKEACLQLRYIQNSPNYEQIKDYLMRRITALKLTMATGERYYYMRNNKNKVSQEIVEAL